MEELPTGSADPTYGYMYRKSSVDLVFPCAANLEQAKDAILGRIERLLYNMESMATLQNDMSIAFSFNVE